MKKGYVKTGIYIALIAFLGYLTSCKDHGDKSQNSEQTTSSIDSKFQSDYLIPHDTLVHLPRDFRISLERFIDTYNEASDSLVQNGVVIAQQLWNSTGIIGHYVSDTSNYEKRQEYYQKILPAFIAFENFKAQINGNQDSLLTAYNQFDSLTRGLRPKELK